MPGFHIGRCLGVGICLALTGYLPILSVRFLKRCANRMTGKVPNLIWAARVPRGGTFLSHVSKQ